MIDKNAYNQQVADILNRRAEALHKATSLSLKLPHRERNRREHQLRLLAADLWEKLLDTVVEHCPDNRPEPLPEIKYNGRRMVLQSYIEGEARYVLPEAFLPPCVIHVTPYRDHVEAELKRR